MSFSGTLCHRLVLICLVVMLAMTAVAIVCNHERLPGGKDELVPLYKESMVGTVKIIVDMGDGYNRWSGSGVFIENDVVLTAGHVLAALNEHITLLPEHVTIQLHDGRLLEAVDLYAEDYTYADVGIIRIKEVPEDFNPHLPKFDTTQDVGESIYAIGAPFGIFPTLTHGVVSQEDVDFMDTASKLLQTDCALNPGNSGGPIFDMDGDLVGLCVAGMGAARQSSGVNFCENIATCVLSINKWKATRAVEALLASPEPEPEPEVVPEPEVDETAEAIEDLQEEIKDVKDSLDEINGKADEIESIKDQLDEIAAEIAELEAKKVEDAGVEALEPPRGRERPRR